MTYPDGKRKSGRVVIGDLPRWRNDLIVMGDLPKKGRVVVKPPDEKS